MEKHIPEDIIDEFKRLYVKESGLGIESDETFQEMLETSYLYIQQHTDVFDIESEPVGKQLVFDKARYIRANASELFYQNYLSDMNAFGLYLATERDLYDSQTFTD